LGDPFPEIAGGVLQAKLEDLLRNKERELKLYQRFLDLKGFCETRIFPQINLPLQEHIETLKRTVEKIVPDARDRREEMFSGEIFTLLGTIYLHDIELVRNPQWGKGPVMAGEKGGSAPAFFLSYEIAKNLDIPEMAMEIINYLAFSGLVKGVPLEWEISEDSRRAIIRNTRLIDRVFNFSHLLVDVFCTELEHGALRRFDKPVFALQPQSAAVDIDSREGIITIRYDARLPYELHTLARVRPFIENGFNSFKNGVNGKLGFQYRELRWDVSATIEDAGRFFEMPRFTAYNELERPPLDRSSEAAEILDRLFDHGHAIVVGALSTGKTTVLKAFLMPQLRAANRNVFYVELWDHPVDEVREVIGGPEGKGANQSVDIVVLCRELLRQGPCFFILDGCERLSVLSDVEREKLERFLDFCLSQANVFVIASGDMTSFFRWYRVFSGMSLASVYEVKPLGRKDLADGTEGLEIDGEEGEPLMPVELELRKVNKDMEGLLGHVLAVSGGSREARSLIAALLGPRDGHLRRYTVDGIRFNTALPKDRILGLLEVLKGDDIVRQTEFMGASYYALSSLYLMEPLYRVFGLGEFDGRRDFRKALRYALTEGVLPGGEVLSLVGAWLDDMMFGADEAGVLLAGLIRHEMEWRSFYDKVRGDGRGIDIQPILAFLEDEAETRRANAIVLLGLTGDKTVINPLLRRLREEAVPALRRLLVKAIADTKGKGAVLAVMKTLDDLRDVAMQVEALDMFQDSFGPDVADILVELKDKERAPEVRGRIDAILAGVRGT
jgi:hypothetical protein